MGDTQRLQTVSTKLRRLADRAAEDPELIFTSIINLVDVDLLREAYRLTRKSGAPGVDGQTASEYGEQLEENLEALHARMRAGKYRAPPVRRVFLDKPDGSQRPIGIPTFEDKIVQRAVAMVMGAIYEQDFMDCSYGFRPGRSAHDALSELREQCFQQRAGWIIDADVSGFFDNLDHDLLREVIKKRIKDGGILRFVGKWLKAGVVTGDSLERSDRGTPQGGVISPLLANIYLHTALDRWFHDDVQPRLRGRSFLVRFADDFVIGCELEEDARRVLAVLPKRFGRFGLEIHPTKTRLVNFRRPRNNGGGGGGGNGTFEFLGFTHHWARSRKGSWVIKRRTAPKRLQRTMRALHLWCRNHRHDPLPVQQRVLRWKLLGHYGYFGVIGNYQCLEKVYRWTRRTWRKWLGERGHRKGMNWPELEKLVRAYPLPTPRITHSC